MLYTFVEVFSILRKNKERSDEKDLAANVSVTFIVLSCPCCHPSFPVSVKMFFSWNICFKMLRLLRV